VFHRLGTWRSAAELLALADVRRRSRKHLFHSSDREQRVRDAPGANRQPPAWRRHPVCGGRPRDETSLRVRGAPWGSWIETAYFQPADAGIVGSTKTATTRRRAGASPGRQRRPKPPRRLAAHRTALPPPWPLNRQPDPSRRRHQVRLIAVRSALRWPQCRHARNRLQGRQANGAAVRACRSGQAGNGNTTAASPPAAAPARRRIRLAAEPAHQPPAGPPRCAPSTSRAGPAGVRRGYPQLPLKDVALFDPGQDAVCTAASAS